MCCPKFAEALIFSLYTLVYTSLICSFATQLISDIFILGTLRILGPVSHFLLIFTQEFVVRRKAESDWQLC